MSTLAWVLVGTYLFIGALWYFFTIGVVAKEIEEKRPPRWKIVKAGLMFTFAWPFVLVNGLGMVWGGNDAIHDNSDNDSRR